jgi:hypothetical protein
LVTLPSEAQEVVNVLSAAGWRVQLIQEPATRLELWRTLDKGPFALGWVGTHSGKAGFALAKEILSPDLFGNFIDESGCADLVLNSCFSAEHVRTIQAKAKRCSIVATIDPAGIDDQTAWSSALFLVRRFARNGDMQEAVDKEEQYRYFPARGGAMDNEALRRLEATTDRLVRALQGEEFSRTPGLIASMQSLQNEMREYVRADAEWKRKTEARIETIEEIQAQGRIVTMQGRSVAILLASMVILISIIALATRILAGGWW